jgi:hypothetical protein
MKNSFLKYLIATFYFCSTFMLMAQSPPEPGSGGDGTDPLEGVNDVDPSVPITDYLWVLILVGVVYVYLRFRKLEIATRSKYTK